MPLRVTFPHSVCFHLILLILTNGEEVELERVEEVGGKERATIISRTSKIFIRTNYKTSSNMRLREASSSSPHIFLRCCLLHFVALLNTASEWFVIKCCLCHFGRLLFESAKWEEYENAKRKSILWILIPLVEMKKSLYCGRGLAEVCLCIEGFKREFFAKKNRKNWIETLLRRPFGLIFPSNPFISSNKTMCEDFLWCLFWNLCILNIFWFRLIWWT